MNVDLQGTSRDPQPPSTKGLGTRNSVCASIRPTEFGCEPTKSQAVLYMLSSGSRETGKGAPYGAYIVVGGRVDVEKDYKLLRYFSCRSKRWRENRAVC